MIETMSLKYVFVSLPLSPFLMFSGLELSVLTYCSLQLYVTNFLLKFSLPSYVTLVTLCLQGYSVRR